MAGMRGSLTLVLLTIAGAVWTSAVSAHGGGLNAEGCHNNRKTGDYHCHRAPSVPRTQASPYTNSLAPRSNYRSTGQVFRNCAEARAVGAAPVRRGDPGYGPHLDRDGDGVGCE